MKIVEVNFKEDITKTVGLRQISMKKVGNTILLAGKNGSGKTRLLNIIRQQTANLALLKQQKEQSKNQIKNFKQQILQQPQQKQTLENKISNRQNQIKQFEQQISHQKHIIQSNEQNIKQSYEKIDQLEQKISENPQKKQFLENQINYHQDQIKEIKQQISQLPLQIQNLEQQIIQLQDRAMQLEQQIAELPQQKQSFEQHIRKQEVIANTPIPILADNGDENIIIVDFVPNKIDLEGWSNHNKQTWMQRADQARQLGVSNLHQATLPLIQKVLDRWINTTHPMLKYPDSAIQNSTKEYQRLQTIVKSFLGTEIGWNQDGFSTIFDRPIATAHLSAGQRVLLQLCVAIYAQGGTFSDHIIFMDEPENHLHPSAVIDLLDTIKEHNPNGQLWIATHSIPLLSHFDASSLWFVEDGTVKHSGKKPEEVLKSLLGNEERIQKLKDFTSLPGELARNRFAFECLCPPQVVETDANDPQSKQLNDQLKIIWEKKKSINLLDFGAGKGRMIANLADYKNVSPDKLNYHAFDPSDSDKEHCLKNIALSYPNEAERYHNSIENLRSNVDDNYFDVVVLSNVLHEIPHQNWCETFSNIKKNLKTDGYLLLIEDCRIPTGELAHSNGFIVFNTLHLKKLFCIPATDKTFIKHDARFDSSDQRGRLMAHLIPVSYLKLISSETIKEALLELKISAMTEVRKIRNGESSYSNGLAHSFWVQQLANAILCLTELGE
ncbi:MAG: methyltransferase domain-containing protein [Calditrichaeota bacterium]|nr:MAG: methyltransferase domain-containing protein [Calditrichota bacterium]MBL1207797.1 methyltransferase domain-containing protein [Calditrichota bacterium]NOG47631.1 AAA family ATPase [Calditrichota bacterium]